MKLISELMEQITKGRSPENVADTLQMLVDNPRSIGISAQFRQSWQAHWELLLEPYGFLHSDRLCSCILDVIKPMYTASFFAPLASAPEKNMETLSCFTEVTKILGVQRVVALPCGPWPEFSTTSGVTADRFWDSVLNYDSGDDHWTGNTFDEHLRFLDLPNPGETFLEEFPTSLYTGLLPLLHQQALQLREYRPKETFQRSTQFQRTLDRNLIEMIAWRVCLHYRRQNAKYVDPVLDLWRRHGYYPLTIAQENDHSYVLYVLSE